MAREAVIANQRGRRASSPGTLLHRSPQRRSASLPHPTLTRQTARRKRSGTLSGKTVETEPARILARLRRAFPLLRPCGLTGITLLADCKGGSACPESVLLAHTAVPVRFLGIISIGPRYEDASLLASDSEVCCNAGFWHGASAGGNLVWVYLGR